MPENGPSIQRQFWSAKEAAAYIGVYAETLIAFTRRRTNSKKTAPRLIGTPPPCRKFGRQYKFPVDQFKQWALEDRYPHKHRTP